MRYRPLSPPSVSSDLRKHGSPSTTGSTGAIDQVMASSNSTTKLCEVCSKLDIQHLTHPIHPCPHPLPCFLAPVDPTFITLGSIDAIKDRRSTCDFCKLIAECLDNESSHCDGHYDVLQTQQLCNFKLPRGIEARDASNTHFHLTELSVHYEPPTLTESGPSLPWVKANVKDGRSRYRVQILQVSQT